MWETCEQLATRSFDEPLDLEQEGTLRVWGDHLQERGDPRGMRIAQEYAIRAQPARRHQIAGTIASTPELGAIVRMLEHRRAVELEWRAGLLYSAFIDVRRIPKGIGLAPYEIVELLYEVPAARTLRRLHMRLRRLEDRYRILNELRREEYRFPPLEEIALMSGIRPSTIGRPETFTYTVGSAFDWQSNYSLVVAFPKLRLFVVDEALVPLPLDDTAIERVRLGRELTCNDEVTRARAIARVSELGPAAFALVETLLVMLEPAMPVPQAEVVQALVAIGRHARIALPLLAKITGRPGHYDVATRRAAGAAIKALI